MNFKEGEVLYFDKPLGWTSFKVVGHARYHICRRMKVKKLKVEHEIDATYPTEHITRELVEETLKTFVGEIQQVPPAFSACKVDGARAYDLARKGQEVELKPKLLVIDEIELLECNLPEIKIRVVCSKGTYIRALARDIGEALQSGAHLTGLIRTRVGEIKLEQCLDPAKFAEWIDQQEVEISD